MSGVYKRIQKSGFEKRKKKTKIKQILKSIIRFVDKVNKT